MAQLTEVIVKALKNLGGKGTLKEIFGELQQINPSPRTWPGEVRLTIEANSSDSRSFKGEDLFRRDGNGVWALRNWEGKKSAPPSIREVIIQKSVNYSIPDSIETISSYLQTIKEYREYYNPASPGWVEYIREFFHVMGFRTEDLDPRHIFLKEMVGRDSVKAIVGILDPGKNFEEMTPGMNQESRLLTLAGQYNVSWGIFTDGLQLRVINYHSPRGQGIFFWPDLEEIIENQKLERFFPVFEIFSAIKDNRTKLPPANRKQEHVTIKQPTIHRKLEPTEGTKYPEQAIRVILDNVSFEKYIENSRKMRVRPEINERWLTRIVPNDLQRNGREGAENYLAVYGRGIMAPKLIQLALKAEMEGYPEMALGFWLKAYELDTGEKVDSSQYPPLI